MSTQTLPPDELLTIDEVAVIVKAYPSTVRRWYDSGRMPRPLKIGGALRFSRRTLDEWIAAGCPKIK